MKRAPNPDEPEAYVKRGVLIFSFTLGNEMIEEEAGAGGRRGCEDPDGDFLVGLSLLDDEVGVDEVCDCCHGFLLYKVVNNN